MSRHLVVPLGALALLVLPLDARAKKTDIIPDDIKKKAGPAKAKKKKKSKKKKKPKQGWIPQLQLGFSFAFAQSRGVVGVPDGTTVALGLNLDGSVTYRRGPHEWVNTLKILHTQTKVPNIKPFIKAADQLDLTTAYFYRFRRAKWLAIFGGLRLTTPLLPGNLVRKSDTRLRYINNDGTTRVALAAAQRSVLLTAAFAPLFFRQFAGVGFRPTDKPTIRVDVKVGLGAIEAWTQQGYAVRDDGATPNHLELQQLRDYVQGGIELQVALTGTVLKKVLTYSLLAEVMYPFATSIDTGLSASELFNVELAAKLSIKLFKYAAINYALAVLRAPLIVNQWQVTNTLMLAVTVDILK